jgi:hypothetical protein
MIKILFSGWLLAKPIANSLTLRNSNKSVSLGLCLSEPFLVSGYADYTAK